MSFAKSLSKVLAVGVLAPIMVAGAQVDDVGGIASGGSVSMPSPMVAAAISAGSLSLTGGESTMSPRFFRSGTPGDACSTFSSGNFQYTTIPFQTNGSGSLRAIVDPQTCGTGVFVTFHVGAFNPSSICSGYQWSFGSSQAFDQTFSVPANTAMTMVLSGVANAPGVNCGPVTYSLDGTGGAASSIPVNNPWAMVVLAALVGVAGWRLRSSRQA